MTNADPVSLARNLLQERWLPTGTGALDFLRHLNRWAPHADNVLAALGRSDVLGLSLQGSDDHGSILIREVLLVLSATTRIGEYKRSNGLHSLLLLWQRVGGEKKISELMLSVYCTPFLWRRRQGCLQMSALKVFAEHGGKLSLADCFALPGILERRWRTAQPSYANLPLNRRQDIADTVRHLQQNHALRPYSASDENSLRRAFPGQAYDGNLCRKLRGVAE